MKWLYEIKADNLLLAFQLYMWIADAGRHAKYDFEKGVLTIYE